MDMDRSIWAQGLTREFADLKAVDGIDLAIGSGRVFGFLGPNASGKTTTVRMLTTILKPTAGEAKVAGFDVSKDQGEVRERVGVALQEVGLDGLMTAREMLILQARLFRAVSLKTKNAAAAEAATFAFFPLIFLSSTFVPKQYIGATWLKWAATVNPTTYIYDAMRSLLIDGWKARPLLIGAGVVLAFATFTGILALREARRATQLG